MKKIMQTHIAYLALLAGLLAFGLVILAVRPASAAPQGTYVSGPINTDETWDLSGSPYQVDNYVDIVAGVTLTIEQGVVVENYSGGYLNYNFDVEGTLIANGTGVNPIHFNPGPNGWSGIRITGQPGSINTGSSLTYVYISSGGYGGSGVGANLVLKYSQVEVHNCLFFKSPGDGILGDDATAGGVANVYDSNFVTNAGYAINFENGAVNPVLHNLTATFNGASTPYGGNLVMINDATLHGLHTWENMGLPYGIRGTNVGLDANLVIQPGVQVLAEPGNDALNVQGVLFANGTASQPIHFDPITPTLGWSGIKLVGTDGLPSAGGQFDHVIITKGGFTGGNCDLHLLYGNATVTNSQLDSSEDSGLCLDLGSTLVMTNTQLTNNQKYAMDVIDAGDRFTLDNLTATGNLSNTIGVEGGTLAGVHTWSKSGINTYDLFYGAVTVAPTGTLNIEPGVTVLFGVSRDITVKGTLNALGTPTQPIVFTGETPETGLWIGINFVGTPERHAVGHFAYATLEYGGYGGSALISIENADVTFQHCILRYCSNDAFKIYPGVVQASLPAGIQAAPITHINWSDLTNIGGYAVDNLGSQPVQASYNWWGAASGPTADDNPGGTGSGIHGAVIYHPYVTGPEGSFIYLPLLGKP